MIKITVFCFTIISSALAINPPREGAIPDSILSLFRSQGIGNEYGNPGLMKKIQRFNQYIFDLDEDSKQRIGQHITVFQKNKQN